MTSTTEDFLKLSYYYDYGHKDRRFNYPFLDVFSFNETGDGRNITCRPDGPNVRKEDVFPLERVDFLGVAGVGVPRRIEAFLVAMFGEEGLDTCMTYNWGHRRERAIPGPTISVPCEKLDKFLKLNPRAERISSAFKITFWRAFLG